MHQHYPTLYYQTHQDYLCALLGYNVYKGIEPLLPKAAGFILLKKHFKVLYFFFLYFLCYGNLVR